jgi:hypothetical protein
MCGLRHLVTVSSACQPSRDGFPGHAHLKISTVKGLIAWAEQRLDAVIKRQDTPIPQSIATVLHEQPKLSRISLTDEVGFLGRMGACLGSQQKTVWLTLW